MMRAWFVVTVMLFACAEDPQPLGPFARASQDPDELRRVLHAAMGHTVGEYVTRNAEAYAMRNEPNACPRLTTTGTTTTVAGDCYRDSDKLLGSMVIDNFWGAPQYDALRATHIAATGYGIATMSGEGSVVFDGTYHLDPARNTRDIALALAGVHHTSRADLALVCEGSMCTAQSGSTFSFSHGGSTYAGEVEGTWSNVKPFAGTITLRAADVITFDLSGGDCIPYELSDGSSGCLQ